MKIINQIFIILCLLLLSVNQNYAAEADKAAITGSLINSYDNFLTQRGWHTAKSDNGINAYSFDTTRQFIEVFFSIDVKENSDVLISVESAQNSSKAKKTFLFRKHDAEMNKNIENTILPYLISLTNFKNQTPPPSVYHTSFTLGYYRTNDNSDIVPDKENGLFLLKWKFLKDPLKNIFNDNTTLVLGDYLDSSYNLTLNHNGSEIFEVIDEFDFNIEILVYGHNSASGTEEHNVRNLYGWFSNIAYFRPYLAADKMLWDDEIYRDHVHVQYCYWTPASFIHNITRTDNGRSLFFSYELGIGPSQNSSITANGISNAEADQYDDRIFVSQWYRNHGFPRRKHNYYWSMAVPAKISMAADRYLNSRVEFKNEFYYFQSVFSKEVYDFYNKASFEYGYYITDDLIAGFCYEYHYTSGNSDQNTISPNSESHSWNRFNIQVEMKI